MKIVSFSIALLASCACWGAQAKDISVTLNDDEQRALVQLLDQANKSGGLQNAETVIYFVKKMQAQTQQPAAPLTAPSSAQDSK